MIRRPPRAIPFPYTPLYVALGSLIALARGLLVPLARLDVVLRHAAVTVLICDAEVAHRNRIAVICAHLGPAHLCTPVIRHAPIPASTRNKIAHRSRVALLRG